METNCVYGRQYIQGEQEGPLASCSNLPEILKPVWVLQIYRLYASVGLSINLKLICVVGLYVKNDKKMVPDHHRVNL